MKQLSIILVVLFCAGSEGFFLDWFKPKKAQSYGYPQPSPGYSYYRPTQQYKVPVWQALPSGYDARPVQSGYDTNNYGTGYGGSAGVAGYENTGGVSYGSPYYPSSGGNSYSSYDAGYVPVYEVNAPNYGSVSGVYDGGNTVMPNSNIDYTGNNPLLSVPVYFPKGTSGNGGYATYSNGVSGFYDANVAGSNVVGVVQTPTTGSS